MAAPIFRISNLCKSFGDNRVVDDLSLEIAAGECLGVIGPNGAGKTTTIRMCLGLIGPDAGSIEAFVACRCQPTRQRNAPIYLGSIPLR